MLFRSATPADAEQVRVLAQLRLDEFTQRLASVRGGASQRLLKLYRITRPFPNMGDFRLGPNMFEHTPLDWIVLSSNDALTGHGIAARIPWDGAFSTLRGGWQRTVRLAYETHRAGQTSNTLVGLFIKVEDEFQEQGWAAKIVDAMKAHAKAAGLSQLIIPLRLPTGYDQANAGLPYEEFAYQEREDGQYRDHWLRLHVRLGAEILGHSLVSHQHALSVDDFHQQFEAERSANSGYRLAHRKNEWYRAYVDADRDCVVVNEGCVWVRHPLESRE